MSAPDTVAEWHSSNMAAIRGRSATPAPWRATIASASVASQDRKDSLTLSAGPVGVSSSSAVTTWGLRASTIETMVALGSSVVTASLKVSYAVPSTTTGSSRRAGAARCAAGDATPSSTDAGFDGDGDLDDPGADRAGVRGELGQRSAHLVQPAAGGELDEVICGRPAGDHVGDHDSLVLSTFTEVDLEDRAGVLATPAGDRLGDVDVPEREVGEAAVEVGGIGGVVLGDVDRLLGRRRGRP